MKKNFVFIEAGMFFLLVFMAMSCASPPPAQSAPVAVPAASPFVGEWEGVGDDGHTYLVEFVDSNWSLYMVESGLQVPFYRGTFTESGNRVTLTFIDELDSSTMGWMPMTSIFPPTRCTLSSDGVLDLSLLSVKLTKI